VILHILIGIAVYILPVLSKVYLLVIFFYFIAKIYYGNKSERSILVLTACGYMVGAEVFIRMTGGSLLYEASKYMVAFFCFLGILLTRTSNYGMSYLVYLVLLIPGIFVAGLNIGENTVIRKAIAFNLSGPVCLGIVAIFCYDKAIKYIDFQKLLCYISLPIITTTVYLFLYNPSVREVISGTGSNFDASGGFGPNQVATMLGMGMFIFAVRFFARSKSNLSKITNLLLLCLVSYRGIITFSRGGIIVALIMIGFFLFFYFKKSTIKNKKRVSFLLTLFIVASFAVWTVSSIETKGFIDKRYTNKDALGREKEDVSTGRGSLISFELNAFIENPIFGVGVGKTKELRLEAIGLNAASHNEVSRILSEHGIFGFFAFSILFVIPLIYRLKNKSNIFFYSCFMFWFLTINHSSMRIAAPAFIYGLALLNIIYEKPPVHRKRIVAKR